jgi:hypothetical protein
MTWRETFQVLAEWYAILAVLTLAFHRSDAALINKSLDKESDS